MGTTTETFLQNYEPNKKYVAFETSFQQHNGTPK